MLTGGDDDYVLRQFEAQIDEHLVQTDRPRGRMGAVRASHETRDAVIAVSVGSAGAFVKK